MISASKRASCKSVTAVIPYYGYSRQDKRSSSRITICAADVAKMLESVGVDRVISLDLHSGQIQGFFGPKIPVDNLSARTVGIRYIISNKIIENLSNCTVVTPDAGGVAIARKFQLGLNNECNNDCVQLAMMVKTRTKIGVSDMILVGDVNDRECLIVDDFIDTGSTLLSAARLLKQRGAKRVVVFATHGIFSGDCHNKIEDSKDIDKVIVTNTVPLVKKSSKIIQISVGDFLAEVIRRVYEKEAVSSLQ